MKIGSDFTVKDHVSVVQDSHTFSPAWILAG